MRLLKWFYPGMNIKRWLFLFSCGVIISALGVALCLNYEFIRAIEELLQQMIYFAMGNHYHAISVVVGTTIFFVGLLIMFVATQKLVHSIIDHLLPGQGNQIMERIFEQSKLKKGLNITVVGGGTGLSVLLRGLKRISSNCTAVVTVADDGGSSGKLREELGILPPGDLRHCLVALADTEPLMAKLMQHRFADTSCFSGHSFGNIFIAAMSQVVGNMELGLSATSEILKVKGSVIPSTLEKVILEATMDDDSIIVGESNIPKVGKRIKKIRMVPKDAKATTSAVEAIAKADILILGPGSLYTSIISNLLIEDIRQAIINSTAQKIYVCNVMTQYGETDGYTVYDHINSLNEYIGKHFIDYVVVNSTVISDQKVLDRYAEEKAYPITIDRDKIENDGIKIIAADLISQTDMIRHNPLKLAQTLIGLVYDLHLTGRWFNWFDYYFTKKIMNDINKENFKDKN